MKLLRRSRSRAPARCGRRFRERAIGGVPFTIGARFPEGRARGKCARNEVGREAADRRLRSLRQEPAHVAPELEMKVIAVPVIVVRREQEVEDALLVERAHRETVAPRPCPVSATWREHRTSPSRCRYRRSHAARSRSCRPSSRARRCRWRRRPRDLERGRAPNRSGRRCCSAPRRCRGPPRSGRDRRAPGAALQSSTSMRLSSVPRNSKAMPRNFPSSLTRASMRPRLPASEKGTWRAVARRGKLRRRGSSSGRRVSPPGEGEHRERIGPARAARLRGQERQSRAPRARTGGGEASKPGDYDRGAARALARMGCCKGKHPRPVVGKAANGGARGVDPRRPAAQISEPCQARACSPSSTTSPACSTTWRC